MRYLPSGPYEIRTRVSSAYLTHAKILVEQTVRFAVVNAG